MTIQKAKDRQWLMAKIDEELAKEKSQGVAAVGKTVNIPDIEKSEGAKRAEGFEIKTPELKGVSKERLAEDIRKLENQESYRRIKAKIPKLMAKYDMQIEGGTPDLVARAKAEKEKMKQVLAVIENKEYDQGLKEGHMSFDDALLLIGVDKPKDL